MNRPDEVWKKEDLARGFIEHVRSAIPMAREQIDIMLKVIASRVPAECSFIDLGCGDGILGRAVRAMYPKSTAYFLDFSQPMIDAALEKAGPADDRLHFLISDYAHPDWTAGVRDAAPFDLIISGFSIHHQPDERKRAIYQEIYALLKPGGLFLNLEHVAPSSPWAEAVSDQLFIDSLWEFEQKRASGRTREEVATEWLSRADRAANLLAPLDDQCEWLRQAGFSDVDCYFKVLELALFGGIKPR